MGVNKVDLSNGETIIDLTSDSVSPETLAEGETAHNSQGERIVGTMSSGGDMLKSIYDTDNNGKVDNADNADNADNSDKLGGQLPSYYAKASDIPTVPTALSQLSQDSTHRVVTDAEKSAWSAKSNFSGNYSDLNNKPVISNKANTGSETWYFPLGMMLVDNSGNYGNFTFTGRIGGWTNANTAVYSIMLMNRANYTGDIITATVSASGQVTNALAVCDIVVAKNSDLSHTVYLKCNGYFCFDFAWTAYQHFVVYNGSYITTEPGGIIWRLSTAPKTILGADGSFTASGGIGGLATVATSGNYNDLNNKPTIPTVPSSLPANGGNADTVDGKHLVTSSSAPTVNDTNIITFVV